MVNYVKVTNYRKTFQNKIFPELNSKKHTPLPTFWVLRNCGIAQNLSFAKAEKGNFARNDFCEWLRKLLFFFAQNWCSKKEKFCVLFRKNCAKVLRMETLFRTNLTIEESVYSREVYCSKDRSRWDERGGGIDRRKELAS